MKAVLKVVEYKIVHYNGPEDEEKVLDALGDRPVVLQYFSCEAPNSVTIYFGRSRMCTVVPGQILVVGYERTDIRALWPEEFEKEFTIIP